MKTDKNARVYFSMYIIIYLGFVSRLFQVPEPNASQ